MTFCSFTSLFTKIIQVACFNYMVMTGEVQKHIEKGTDSRYQTGFVNFYASMIDTPFLGDQYSYILPGTILLFALVFVIINVCNYEAKVVSVLKRMSDEGSAVQDS